MNYIRFHEKRIGHQFNADTRWIRAAVLNRCYIRFAEGWCGRLAVTAVTESNRWILALTSGPVPEQNRKTLDGYSSTICAVDEHEDELWEERFDTVEPHIPNIQWPRSYWKVLFCFGEESPKQNFRNELLGLPGIRREPAPRESEFNDFPEHMLWEFGSRKELVQWLHHCTRLGINPCPGLREQGPPGIRVKLHSDDARKLAELAEGEQHSLLKLTDI